MLENLTFTGRELLMAVVLATVVYLVEVLIFSRRRKAPDSGEARARVAMLQQEVDALRTRVEALELNLATGSTQDNQKTIHAEAMRMARHGASAQELAEQLGISRTEADLIIALYKAES